MLHFWCQFLVSGGADGTAYIYDLSRRALLNLVHYPAGVTCLQPVPQEVGESILTILMTALNILILERQF